MTAQKITLRDTRDKSTHEVALIRAFELDEHTHLILTGTEFDDHELWLLSPGPRAPGMKAELVGTLKKSEYASLRRKKKLNLSLKSDAFAWVRPEFLKSNEERVFAGHSAAVDGAVTSAIYSFDGNWEPGYVGTCRPPVSRRS